MSPEDNATTPPRAQANVRPHNEVEAPPLVQPSKRRRFTIQEKFGLICIVDRLMDTGMSQRAACKEVNIHHSMYALWKKQVGVMVDIKNIRSKTLCLGRASCLAAHREELLRFIFELREQGVAVSVSMVAVKAAQVSHDFALKSRMAKYNSARRFVRSQGLVFRLGTNESQRSPTETAAEALDFMNNAARPKVKDQPGRHPDFILNMDQTPIPFTYNARKTLEIVGRRTVHVRKATNDTKRATFAMTVTASGKLLKPLLVFKGARNGRIVQREFPTFPDDMLYSCQPNAWMDEEVMLLCVDQILAPFVAPAPNGVIPILFLDSYRRHMMASVVTRIQD